eukprot:TRINITY_DN5627_c0_g1_i1.p1 TRINITY_DN5627_c0_g1~~TRINITY_DN5627_c0_g1_i1.p1  ORF type:complete len:129 (-),score=41.27 TRINITY_DN5627_c0_g1_i1:234-587(-)
MVTQQPLTYETALWEGMKKVLERFAEGQKTIVEVQKIVTEKISNEENSMKFFQKLTSKPTTVAEKGSLPGAWQAIREELELEAQLHTECFNSYKKDVLLPLESLKKEQTKKQRQITK